MWAAQHPREGYVSDERADCAHQSISAWEANALGRTELDLRLPNQTSPTPDLKFVVQKQIDASCPKPLPTLFERLHHRCSIALLHRSHHGDEDAAQSKLLQQLFRGQDAENQS